MSWTTPATVVDGQLLDAAYWNTQVRDNQLFLFSMQWPVGSIYRSTSFVDPGEKLGYGTWVSLGPGRIMVGIDAGQTEFDTVEETSGEKTHVLTVSEMPADHHSYNQATFSGGISANGGGEAANFSSPTQNTTDVGGNVGHNNLMPFIVAYRWKRTA